MIPLGKITVAHPLARPILATPEAVVIEGKSHMRLTWVCPAQGVTQFEVSMKGDPPPKTTNGAPVWAINFAGPPPAASPKVSSVNYKMSTDQRTYRVLRLDDRERIRTKTIGDGLRDDPPGSGKYSLDIPVTKGIHYFAISVRAVGGTANTFGPSSNTQSFTWKVIPGEESVPWPARPLPPVQEFKALSGNTLVSVKAALLSYGADEALIVPMPPLGQSADETRLLQRPGVLIGRRNNEGTAGYEVQSSKLRIFGESLAPGIQSVIDPNALLFVRDSKSSDKILPVALYRRTASNGQVMQVTPLMEKIAWQQIAHAGNNTVYDAILHDPYIGVTDDSGYVRFYLLDTQPVTAGETYQYLLVRFDATTKEMLETIDAGTLTIPE
jgi:hypothetical protein